MKVEYFVGLTDANLKLLRNNLCDSYRNQTLIADMPSDVKDYILKDNPSVGNTYTRISRCITLIDMVIVNRFMEQK